MKTLKFLKPFVNFIIVKFIENFEILSNIWVEILRYNHDVLFRPISEKQNSLSLKAALATSLTKANYMFENW